MKPWRWWVSRSNAGEKSRPFWEEAFALKGSPTPEVLPRAAAFGAIGVLIYVAEQVTGLELGIEIAPYEVAAGVLGLLLVLRTNSGYDRWWEARQLWGGIVNQSRNLATAGLVYGPADPAWKDQFVRRVIEFAHAGRCSLRGERELPEIAALFGPDEAARVAAARHMPTRIAADLAEMLREARDRHGMDPFAFLQADRERAKLIDHIGGCERILKTPLPRVYAIVIRRFILLYLGTLPLALHLRVGWLGPLMTMLVAYPVLSLDQVSVELQNPFNPRNLSHLPLDDICKTIETDLLALLEAVPAPAGADAIPARP